MGCRPSGADCISTCTRTTRKEKSNGCWASARPAIGRGSRAKTSWSSRTPRATCSASSTRRALELVSARSLGVGRRPPDTFLRFSRFRFKEGKEAEGLDILRRHSAAIKSAPGCRDVWLAQGQHPATECVVVALFENEDSLRRLEGKLRSDPLRGGDFFALLSLTTQPPDVTQYEVRSQSTGC